MSTHVKFVISIVMVFVLVIFTTSRNSSKNPEFIQLETLDDSEKIELNQLFYNNFAEEIDAFMQRSQHRMHFNGSVMIALDGYPVFQKSYGFKNLASKVPLESTTPFQLASVSKQFTAIAVLMLQEKGELSIEDPVTRFFPKFPYKEITLKMLLQHTSGLPNYFWFMEHHWSGSGVPDNDDMLSILIHHQLPLYFRPGQKHAYSNTGYAVLASVVEKVTGKKFELYLQEEVFSPLGMSDSFVFRYSGNSNSLPTMGFSRSWKRWNQIEPTIHDGIVGDKGIYSTPSDLLKWDQALQSNSLISTELLAEAWEPGIVRNRWNFPYGYGFRIRSTDNKKVVYHHGKWEGFRTSLTRNLDDNLTVILLSNSNCHGFNSIAAGVEALAGSLHNQPEIEIISKAITYGLGYGIEQYRILSEEKSDLNIDHYLIDDAAGYLSSIGKNQLANIVQQLSHSIQSTGI
jgi:CubicO group peptidase (beta-lactamase class C family)